MTAQSPAGPALSQTLSRGLTALELLAASETPLTVDQVAAGLGVHRSIAYRLVRTLEWHRLAERQTDGRYQPGVGLAVLARGVRTDVRTVAEPVLDRLADRLGMTAFVVVSWGSDCVTLTSVEPRHRPLNVAQQPGSVHPLDHGAPGLALLAVMPGVTSPRADEVAEVRTRGYADTRSEVVPGLRSLAVPVPGSSEGGRHGALAVAVVCIDTADVDVPAAVEGLRVGAQELGEALGLPYL